MIHQNSGVFIDDSQLKVKILQFYVDNCRDAYSLNSFKLLNGVLGINGDQGFRRSDALKLAFKLGYCLCIINSGFCIRPTF